MSAENPTDLDLWYATGKDKDFSGLLLNPLLSRALNIVLMEGLPSGSPGHDIAGEALTGAYTRGRTEFYKALRRLGEPKPEPPAPRKTRELVRDDLPTVLPTS